MPEKEEPWYLRRITGSVAQSLLLVSTGMMLSILGSFALLLLVDWANR